MVGAGYLVELLFGLTGLVPAQLHRHRGEARRGEASISWNYTTWINIAFLVVATVLVVRFVGTGGSPMLRMTNGMSDADHRHDHHATAEEH